MRMKRQTSEFDDLQTPINRMFNGKCSVYQKTKDGEGMTEEVREMTDSILTVN